MGDSSDDDMPLAARLAPGASFLPHLLANTHYSLMLDAQFSAGEGKFPSQASASNCKMMSTLKNSLAHISLQEGNGYLDLIVKGTFNNNGIICPAAKNIIKEQPSKAVKVRILCEAKGQGLRLLCVAGC